MEIYKGDPNNNDFIQNPKVMKVNPNELPYPEQDFVYTAWLNYTKGFEAGYEAMQQANQLGQ
jgi:hypothetical protein